MRPGSATGGSQRLVLFYTDMWGQLPRMPSELMPPGIEVTCDRGRLREAAAVVFHLPTLRLLPRRRPPGQLWVAWSLESEENCPRLANPRFMRRFDLTMTYRLDADVPLLYVWQHRDLLAALRERPAPKRSERLVAAFVSSRIDGSGRRAYLRELARHVDVHSYGRYLRNRRLPVDRGRETKLETIAGYKFTLAFENSIARDYVTEKFFDPLVAGSVPVVLGAPNVGELAPGEGCYLDVRDFETPRALAERLLELGGDDAAYGQLHAWRIRPFLPRFVELMEGQRVPAGIRLLRLLRSRLEEP